MSHDRLPRAERILTRRTRRLVRSAFSASAHTRRDRLAERAALTALIDEHAESGYVALPNVAKNYVRIRAHPILVQFWCETYRLLPIASMRRPSEACAPPVDDLDAIAGVIEREFARKFASHAAQGRG